MRVKVVKGAELWEVEGTPEHPIPRRLILERDVTVTGWYLEDGVWEVKYAGVAYTVDQIYIRQLTA